MLAKLRFDIFRDLTDAERLEMMEWLIRLNLTYIHEDFVRRAATTALEGGV